MRFRLLFFGYPLLEILAAWLVAQLLGWGWTLLLLVAGIPIGFYVMRRAGAATFASIRLAGRSGTLPAGAAGTHSLTFIAGLLIAIPGFCTDLLGLVLLLPPIKERIRRRVGSRIEASGLTSSVGFAPAPDVAPEFGEGDFVVGEVINMDAPDATEQGPKKQTGPGIAGPV